MSDRDPTDILAEETRAAEAKAADGQVLREETDDLKWLMSTPKGRRFMWRTLSQAGVYRISFDPESTHLTAFREGARNLGLRLLALIQKHSDADYALMIQENSHV